MSNVYDPNRPISDVLGKTRANEKYTHDAWRPYAWRGTTPSPG